VVAPFVRFSRDKRGYEHFFLIESRTGGSGKPRQRILYWFRTPPNVKVGRKPFDELAARELEAHNPTLTFDWDLLRRTPIPAPAVDWRDRRRTERAARAAIDTDEESVVGEPPYASAAPPPGERPSDRAPSESGEASSEQPAASPSSSSPSTFIDRGGRRRRRRGRRWGTDRREPGQQGSAAFRQQERGAGVQTENPIATSIQADEAGQAADGGTTNGASSDESEK
jgi:hypothetical protein